MLLLTADPMTDATPGELCTYSTIRIDDRVLPVARAAASLAGLTTQEYISNLVNDASAKALRRKPIVRRQPPPKPKGTGRPPKS